MKQNNWLVIGLIVCGIALILASVVLPQNKFNFSFNQVSLAQVIEKTGSAVLFPADSAAEYELKNKTTLNPKDTLRTADDSEVLLQFQNGGQLRVTSNSEVLLDQINESQVVALVKSGDVLIEKLGQGSNYWIRKEGQLLSATDYALVDKNTHSVAGKKNASAEIEEQISQIEIESILSAKKTDFFKCFGQLIQRNPQATGQVLLSFTIERNGNTNKIEVSKTDINDASFKSCLVEVVARTQFRSFSGPPIATVFPLRFE